MKLIIQIPCFNEADTLPATIADLPKDVEGFDTVEVLVIDDGSTDETIRVAQDQGVDHLVRLGRNRGLAMAFSQGIHSALELGADVIVNTDGDNQYCGWCIPDLVKPILTGKADVVIGNRQIEKVRHFSRTKKLLQRIGSWVVRWASGTDVPDAPSGFRALSREAALKLIVFSNYTYTLETIIQAGKKGLVVTSVPVETNEKMRESRLIRSVPKYVLRSAGTILRIFLMYEALRVFLSLGFVLALGGFALILRFLYYYFIGQGSGHVQSLIIAAILVVLGFQTFLLGLLADLIARNRHLSEDMSYRIRKLEFEEVNPDSDQETLADERP
jgi:glycosyltransferase involved in cell wall biosynthesis